MEQTNKVVLRYIKIPEEQRTHYLSAEIKENGDLFLVGWDVTPVAKDFTGDSEYEYEKTIKRDDLVVLRSAFNIPADENILDFLMNNFSGEKSFEFERMLKEKNVPFDLDIW